MSKIWGFFKDSHLLKLLLYEDGRKNGFGMTLFITASFFLHEKAIDAGIWFGCCGIALTLIGGGNIADKYLDIKKETSAPKPAA